MSSQPVLSPEQIAYLEKMIRRGVREELDRIITTGFNCTEIADKEMSGAAPAYKPASEYYPTDVNAPVMLAGVIGKAENLKIPPVAQIEHNVLPFNPELCNWQVPEGKDYRMAKDGQNFKLLVDWLGEHKDKANVNGKFMWLFTRKDAIGWKL
jgi:hypothetical protein